MPSGSTPVNALARIGSAHTSIPKIVAVPASGRSRPTAIDSEVVLPAPFGPTRPKNDPGGTTRSTWSAAMVGPNRLYSRVSRRASVMASAYYKVISL
jgi:hypothetical protein